MTASPGLGIRVQKGPDFIHCGAALAFEMGGYNIGRAADFLFYAFSRLLHLDIRHRITLTFH